MRPRRAVSGKGRVIRATLMTGVALAMLLATFAFISPTSAVGISPSARMLHRMIYDSRSDRIVLYSGGPAFHAASVNDMWAYDVLGRLWTELRPSTLPMVGDGSMAYDSQSDRTILLQNRETWAYNLSSNTWTNMMPATSPPAPSEGRRGPRMAYDAESDRTILFGGLDAGFNSLFNDTWAYDFEANTWTEMRPAVHPPGRAYPGMTYVTGPDRILLFGGAVGNDRLNDTWAYDFNSNTWTDLNPATHPSARGSPAMEFNRWVDRTILFGGVGPIPGDVVNNETWSFNYAANAWVRLTTAVSPPPRAWHGMAYVNPLHVTVLFGWGPDRATSYDDLWIYGSETNTWRRDNSLAPPTATPPLLSIVAIGALIVAAVAVVAILLRRRRTGGPRHGPE